MKRTVAIVMALPFAIVACLSIEEQAPADPLQDVFNRQAQEEGLSRVQTEGKRLFIHYCATCHGEAGHGDGQNAYNLDPKPRDYQESLRQHPSSYWRDIIVGGTAAVGRSPLCPPLGRNLTTADVDALLSYLEVLTQSVSPEPASKGEAERAH